jgi:CRISPR type I-E-associated protein CasB/Cse2
MIKRTPANVEAVQSWWRKLQPNPASGYRGDRAAIAQLRHAENIVAASLQPATIELCRALRAQPGDMSFVGLIAAILADLRSDESALPVARALGSPEGAPLCSSLRFRRILEATDLDVQLTALRRALALLKHKGHLKDLINSLLDWNDPDQRDMRRQRWLYDYYQANNPEPSPAVEPN